MNGDGNIKKSIVESEVNKPQSEDFKVYHADDMSEIKAMDSEGNEIPFASGGAVATSKKFKAILLQSGANAPTIKEILFNDLGFVPTFVRQYEGYYKLQTAEPLGFGNWDKQIINVFIAGTENQNGHWTGANVRTEMNDPQELAFQTYLVNDTDVNNLTSQDDCFFGGCVIEIEVFI